MKPKVPITLFTYARPDHTCRTVEALMKNPLAELSDLIIFSDAACTPDQESSVDAVRTYLKTIKGFRSVTIHNRPHNFGLAKSIIEGVSQVLAEHERVIVLEDDMVTSPHFLTYMNEALDRFADDERVISIHGYIYPVKHQLPEAFFLLGADCWGWATWRRGWRLFNPDGKALLDKLKRRNLIKSFDFNGTYSYSNMLEGQIKGENDSWAIRWYASAFLAGKLTLYPGRSLVHNIGNDNSGRHCGTTISLDTEVSSTPINLKNMEVKESRIAHQAIEGYFRNKQISMKKILSRLDTPNIYEWMKIQAKEWLPPKVTRRIKHFTGTDGIRFEGDFATWEQAAARCKGYDSEEILAKVLAATLKVKRGEAAFERDSVLFDEIEYSWPVLAGLMWAAAQDRGGLSVLDFGGALGSTYFQHQELLQALPRIRWNVVEQSHYVQAGQRHIQNEQLRFYPTIDASLADSKPNVILLSSVLQYLPEPFSVLDKLSKCNATLMIIDRTPFSFESIDRLVIQHVPSKIYSANYPMWIFAHDKFYSHISSKWKILASNISPEGYVKIDWKQMFTFKGILLKSK